MVQALWKVGGWWQGSQNHQGPAPLVPDLGSADGDRQLRGNGKVKKKTKGTWSMEFFLRDFLWISFMWIGPKITKMMGFHGFWYPKPVAILMPGTPYMLYKDHCNRKSNQQNLGSLDQRVGSEKIHGFTVVDIYHVPLIKYWKMTMYVEHITMLHIKSS